LAWSSEFDVRMSRASTVVVVARRAAHNVVHDPIRG
jgi:hypothetical protein